MKNESYVDYFSMHKLSGSCPLSKIVQLSNNLGILNAMVVASGKNIYVDAKKTEMYDRFSTLPIYFD